MRRYPEGRLALENSNWKFLGATLNPVVAPYVNWTGISRRANNLQVIHYWRSNKVKHAIATYRAELLKKTCGVFVYINSEWVSDTSCVIPQKIILHMKKFRNSLKRVFMWDSVTVDTISKLVSKLRRKIWYTVMYED